MVRLPGNSDPIEYLVKRRFPDARFLTFPPRLHSSSPATGNDIRRKRLADLNAYRQSLREKSAEELKALFDAEREREIAEIQAKAEREECERFFNRPYAAADFAHWSKAAYWTLEEAVALSFGKDPKLVNWKAIHGHLSVSPFAKRFALLRDLALRAKAMNQLYDPVTPGVYIAWAKRSDVAFPEELEAAVIARGHLVADWKTHYDAIKQDRDSILAQLETQTAQIKQLQSDKGILMEEIESLWAKSPPDPEEAPLQTRERETLLKLVIGMAVEQYGYDPKSSRSETTRNIAEDLAQAGVPLDPDTVRKWLRKGAELLPPAADEPNSTLK